MKNIRYVYLGTANCRCLVALKCEVGKRSQWANGEYSMETVTPKYIDHFLNDRNYDYYEISEEEFNKIKKTVGYVPKRLFPIAKKRKSKAVTPIAPVTRWILVDKTTNTIACGSDMFLTRKLAREHKLSWQRVAKVTLTETK